MTKGKKTLKFCLKENNNIVLYFDLLVYPTGFHVKSIDTPKENKGNRFVYDMNAAQSPEEYINNFLISRSVQWKYTRGKELDEYVCKRLGLKPSDFGRMDEFQGLVGLLDNFRIDSDNYSAAPVQPEVLYFGEMDCRLTRLYFIS